MDGLTFNLFSLLNYHLGMKRTLNEDQFWYLSHVHANHGIMCMVVHEITKTIIQQLDNTHYKFC